MIPLLVVGTYLHVVEYKAARVVERSSSLSPFYYDVRQRDVSDRHLREPINRQSSATDADAVNV